MRFEPHGDLLARIGVSLSQADAALPNRVRLLLGDAINIVWAFYTRPLDDGVKWALPKAAGSLAAFHSACLTREGYLIELCRDLRDHDGLSAHESEVLSALVAIADLFSGQGNSAADWIVPGAGGSRLDSPHDVGLRGHPPLTRFTGLRADFRIASLQHRVKLRNLSATGVMVTAAPPSCEGKAASIRLRGGAWLSGSVVWSLEDRCGVAFADPQDPLVEFARRLFADGHLDC